MASRWRCTNLDKYKETVVNIQSGEIAVIERDYTAEEIADMEAEMEQIEQTMIEPSIEDRLSALESALLEMITGGETGG